MCGYVERFVSPRVLREFMELLGMQSDPERTNDEEPIMQRFYPAFGGDSRRTIDGLLIMEGGQLKLVNATWWYDCQEMDGTLVVGPKTTFNARNLHYAYWREAIRKRRAIVIATGLGEGKTINGKNHHYLVTSERLLFLGAVYQAFPSGHYSCAVITRDAHPRFEPYHDKAFPLFLPSNLDFLKLWLSEADDGNSQVAHILENPKIFSDLKITRVKTFKGAVPISKPEYLAADWQQD